MGRYAVFIDGGYAKKVFQEFGNPRISYLKFSDYVANRDERLRTYYYDCAPYVSSPPTSEERAMKQSFDRFTYALQRESRLQVRRGRLAKRPLLAEQPKQELLSLLRPAVVPQVFEQVQDILGKIRYEQKMVDILLAIDLVQLSVQHQIQRAVLLANDSDFVPAIEIARSAGTVVELYYHIPPRPHDELMQACDDNIQIDQAVIESITV